MNAASRKSSSATAGTSGRTSLAAPTAPGRQQQGAAQCTCSPRQAPGAHLPAQRAERRLPCQPPRALDPLAVLAVTDPAALQDVLVGGAVTAAVGAALVSGLRKDPEPCDLCQGTGGIQCFACQGDGLSTASGSSMDSMDGDLRPIESARPPKRDFVGRSSNPRACRVCGGTGLVLCSQCRGSGYVSKGFVALSSQEEAEAAAAAAGKGSGGAAGSSGPPDIEM